MRLVSFAIGGEVRPGLRLGERVVDIRDVAPSLPPSMLDIVGTWDECVPVLSAIAEGPLPLHAQHRVEDVELVAPISPHRILATGTNYADHVAEMEAEVPSHPSAFPKLPASVMGPDAELRLGAHTPYVDYEGEIALVVGRPVRDVNAEAALAAVLGLTLANDISSRDVPMAHIVLAKGSPGFCPLGPEIVTLDELDLDELSFTVTVNGEVRQSGQAMRMIHKFADLVAAFSSGLPLEPGDVLLTGTPAGVGIGMDPPRFLEDGDVVVVSSPQLGSLRTRIRRDPVASLEGAFATASWHGIGAA